MAQLVLHYVTDPDQAMNERRRVVRPGGMIAACVWDYSKKMEMLRHFWDAALEVASPYRDFDELWAGFLAGIDQAGSFCVSLSADKQAAVRHSLFERVGSPSSSFTLAAPHDAPSEPCLANSIEGTFLVRTEDCDNRRAD